MANPTIKIINGQVYRSTIDTASYAQQLNAQFQAASANFTALQAALAEFNAAMQPDTTAQQSPVAPVSADALTPAN